MKYLMRPRDYWPSIHFEQPEDKIDFFKSSLNAVLDQASDSISKKIKYNVKL